MQMLDIKDMKRGKFSYKICVNKILRSVKILYLVFQLFL